MSLMNTHPLLHDFTKLEAALYDSDDPLYRELCLHMVKRAADHYEPTLEWLAGFYAGVIINDMKTAVRTGERPY